jgi:hypothetical protein
MLLRSAFLGAVLFATSVPLLAQDAMTRLKVEVQTLTGRPVDRASVIVDFVEGRSLIKLGKKIITHWEVRSNQEGVAKVPALPQGKARIQVIAKGYQTYGQVYDLDQDEKTITIKLNPPQPQHSEHQ